MWGGRDSLLEKNSATEALVVLPRVPPCVSFIAPFDDPRPWAARAGAGQEIIPPLETRGKGPGKFQEATTALGPNPNSVT